jgi:hypothetical protein
MKKLLLLTLLSVFVMGSLQAQLKVYKKPVKNTQNLQILNQDPPPPPPPTTNKTEAPITKSEVPTSVYYLTSARVNIRTGNDNKEFPSEVYFQLSNDVAFIMQQRGENMRNEMKINSNTEFGLEKISTKPEDFTLESMKKKGIELRIVYFPDFISNAWKIEGVNITLEFKDQNGTLHPTLGSKTIVFNNASGFLDTFNKTLLCKTDGELNPTTSSIKP